VISQDDYHAMIITSEYQKLGLQLTIENYCNIYHC